MKEKQIGKKKQAGIRAVCCAMASAVMAAMILSSCSVTVVMPGASSNSTSNSASSSTGASASRTSSNASSASSSMSSSSTSTSEPSSSASSSASSDSSSSSGPSSEENGSSGSSSSESSSSSTVLDEKTKLEQFRQEVLRLVNVERAKENLDPVQMGGSKLTAVAQLRAEEISKYYSHTRPNGTKCFTALTEGGISYSCAGENIAWGHNALETPEAVVTAWMNSPGHRANILNANYTQLGIGYVEIDGDWHYWAQMFIRPNGSTE